MPPKGRNKKLAKKGFDWKDTERFDKTSSEEGWALDNLESQLRQLKAGKCVMLSLSFLPHVFIISCRASRFD